MVEWPCVCELPDLSDLTDDLLGRWALSITLIDCFPPGVAQFLVSGYIRTVEAALRRYNRARGQLETASREGKVIAFMRGCSEMETTVWLVHKAIRWGVALAKSPETKVSSRELPAGRDRERLQAIRNALDHDDEPVRDGRAGQGDALSLEVRSRDMTIHDLNGHDQTVTFDALAEWMRKLHALAVELIDRPSEWAAQTSPA
jgi:hypothetical protein